MRAKEYQLPAIENSVRALRQHGSVIDASDPGVGKTFMALDLCRRVGVRPAVVAPLAAIPGWQWHCKEMGLEPAFIHTWELLSQGRRPGIFQRSPPKWTISGDALLICDEFHKAKSWDTAMSQMMCRAATEQQAVVMLSATMCDNPMGMRALGANLGWFPGNDAAPFWQWAFRSGVRRVMHPLPRKAWRKGADGKEIKMGKSFGFAPRDDEERTEILARIHARIFPEHGTRLRTADIPNFPKTTIIPECHELPAKHVKELAAMLEEIRAKDAAEKENETSTVLTQILRERQYAETAKIPILEAIIRDEIDNGQSVPVFVSFLATLEHLATKFDAPVIRGDQTVTQRAAAMDSFQSNKSRVIVCQVSAGGQSINLDDRDGKHPRTSVICPTYSVTELRQILGRVHRTTAMSPSRQRVVYAAGTVEEEICEAVRKKLDNLDLLNDGEISNLVFNNRTEN